MDEWTSTVAELSVPIALIGLYAVAGMFLPAGFRETQRTWIRAVFLVALGLSSMVFHLHVDQGVYFDQRGATIAVATLFGGLWVGGATATVEAIYRYSLGGAATWAGIAGIAGDLLGSILVLYYLRNVRNMTLVRFRTLALLGVVVGLTEALSLLLIPPFEYGWAFFRNYGFMLFFVQLFSTVFLGGLLAFEDSRMDALSLLQKKSDALRRSLDQVVGALSLAMLHRDPTTAGHERRVADFAVAVGQHLGLGKERLDGLHLASLAHDVGQIQIPAEILTRPRALIKEEFELVKMHVDAGYQILKDVDFPWPIADIVRQHHENFDGTGYPLGLKSDGILLEARIIRVCDSVEAMLAHRPFRRAYTKQQVLDELRSQRGTKLDPQVVDACVWLIEENGYTFEK